MGDTERTYALHVPADNEEPLPLIIALHGYGDTGSAFLRGTGLDAAAAEAFVAAPSGIDTAWADAPYAATTVEEDTEFVNAVVAEVERDHAIDPERVYLVGFSNGGGLATEIAARDPHSFAGLATVAAAVRAAPESLGKGAPIDYLNIHGRADAKVPYGGERRSQSDIIYPAREVVDAFEKRNGNNARTEHRAIEGMGHSWPTAHYSGFNTGEEIDVNDEILTFFGIGHAANP